ncbi:MAG: diphthine synthase [Nanoarchaeota archaeon]
MTLYLIGLGLSDEKDISIKGLEIIKRCDTIFLESYTSKLDCKVSDLEELYKKKVIVADRNLIENSLNKILDSAKKQEVAILIIGDVFSATTHINILLECKNMGVRVNVIHNASILTAIGEIGLDVYKFGRTISIPLENKDVKSPVKFLKDNLRLGLHTLILLDCVPLENKFLDINLAVDYLIMNGLKESTDAIGCSALGSDKFKSIYTDLKRLKKEKFRKFPQCIVIPGKLHFIEKEMLESWKIKDC